MDVNGVAITNEEAREQTRRRSYYIIAGIVFTLWVLSDSSIGEAWSNDSKSEEQANQLQNFVNTTLVMQTTAIPFSQLKNALASVLWEAIDAFVNSTYAPNITTTYIGTWSTMNASTQEYQGTFSNGNTQRIFVLPSVDPTEVMPTREGWPQTTESTSKNTDMENSLRTGHLSLSLSTTFLHTLVSPDNLHSGRKITPTVDESSPGVFSTHAFLRVEHPPDNSFSSWLVDPAPLLVTEMEGIHLAYSGRVALFSLPLRSLNLATKAHPTSLPVYTRRALTSGVPIRLHARDGQNDTQVVTKIPLRASSKPTDGRERLSRALDSKDEKDISNTSARCFLEMRLQARPFDSPVTTTSTRTSTTTTATHTSTTALSIPQVHGQRHKRPQSGLGKHPHLRGHNARHAPSSRRLFAPGVSRRLEENSFSFYGRQAASEYAEQSMKAMNRTSYVIVLQGTLTSPNCPGLRLNVTLRGVHYDQSKLEGIMLLYLAMMSSVTLAQMYILIAQIRSAQSQSAAIKISLLLVGGQALLDAYLCLLHTVWALTFGSFFKTFFTIALLKCILFSVLESRFLMYVWRAHHPQAFNNGIAQARRAAMALLTRFYGTLMGGLVVFAFLRPFFLYAVFVLFSFFVPQIVKNVQRNSDPTPLRRDYVLVTAVTRLMLPLYVFGYPGSFLQYLRGDDTPPETMTAILFFAWMSIQALVLMLQRRLGSRFFASLVPAFLLPKPYDYFRSVGAEITLQASRGSEGGIDCAVCMTPVELLSERKKFMLTPCNHVFHTECLERWMELKMDCPTCRQQLPP